MNTLILIFSAVACGFMGLLLIGFGIYLLRRRSREHLLMSMNAQHMPQSRSLQISAPANHQPLSQTVPSAPAPTAKESDYQQRPDGFFMPLPAQLDSENEHSETTMIRNVVTEPDSETTLRPTTNLPRIKPLSERTPPITSRQSQNISPLPEITENQSLPSSLFTNTQQEPEDEEVEDAPTTIFDSNS